MLVSHRKRFVFLKTVKTAGTSVEIYLEPWCRDDGAAPTHETPEHVGAAGIVGCRGRVPAGTRYFNHMPAAEVRADLGEAIWSAYLKIACIRDPFDKTVSAFWMAHPDTPADTPADLLAMRAAFRAYVLSGGGPVDRRVYTLDGAPCCDAYLRYESLEPDLAGVCARLGLPFEPRRLGRYKGDWRPRAIPLTAYYDRETTERVRALFEPEFVWFGYAPEPGDGAALAIPADG